MSWVWWPWVGLSGMSLLWAWEWVEYKKTPGSYFRGDFLGNWVGAGGVRSMEGWCPVSPPRWPGPSSAPPIFRESSGRAGPKSVQVSVPQGGPEGHGQVQEFVGYFLEGVVPDAPPVLQGQGLIASIVLRVHLQDVGLQVRRRLLFVGAFYPPFSIELVRVVLFGCWRPLMRWF